MALPYSGQISMGDINAELGRARATSNTSLAGGSVPTPTSQFGLAIATVNQTPPHSISEFYGYTRKSISFSGLYSISYTGSVGGTVSIVGGTINFSAYALNYSGGTTATTITVNGVSRSITQSGTGSSYSTSFQLGPGSYGYSLSVNILSGGGQGAINTSWA